MFDRHSYRPILISIAMVLICASLAAAGDSSVKIVRIEQDWKVELYSADGDSKYSPQLITAFQLPSHAGLFQITWNHVDSPSYTPGGFQLQAWKAGTLVNVYTSAGSPLSSGDQLLTWTQVASTTGEETGPAAYCLELKSITPSSWTQSTGGSGQVVAATMEADVPHLNGYDSQTCLENSAVVAGSNRVKWFGIVQTRFYDEKGTLVLRDTTPKVIFEQPPEYTYYDLKKLDWKGDVQLLDANVSLQPVQVRP